jgi:hypothetical protein
MSDTVVQASAAYADNIKKSEDFKELYANHLRMAITPVDLAIWFGRITEVSVGNPGVEEQIGIRLSPQTFKTLVGNLNNILAVYESQFGIVPVVNKPMEDILSAFKEAAEKKTSPT